MGTAWPDIPKPREKMAGRATLPHRHRTAFGNNRVYPCISKSLGTQTTKRESVWPVSGLCLGKASFRSILSTPGPVGLCVRAPTLRGEAEPPSRDKYVHPLHFLN